MSSQSPRKKRPRLENPADYDYERFRAKLTRIFFRDGADLIPSSSDDYKDFWRFLRRFKSFGKRRHGAKNGGKFENASRNGTSGVLGLPDRHETDFTSGHCFELLPDDTLDLINRLPVQDEDYDDEVLTVDVVAGFRKILAVYVDFCQKEKFRKLKRLRKSQSELPIAQFRREIVDGVQKNRVVVVAGDTGCGKSTQVPQFLIKAGFRKVACTQPRRIACVALAGRVAHETLNRYGTEIGYQIRFERRKTERTRVLFLTEGLLLRQIASDPSLSGYDVLVLDEVHERHLSGDFLLGAVRQVFSSLLGCKRGFVRCAVKTS